MEKKFRVLRIIGTIWKILAWIVLIIGILSSVGVLLTSVFGGGMLHQFGQQYRMPQPSWLFSVAGGVIVFIGSLFITIVYFLLLYAIGELIYLLLAIEENTRLAAQWIQAHPAPAAYSAAPAPPLSG